jgi:ABC-type transporter Mla maintaining outer membrane lipid asymmetry permease subunit MlaE
MLVRQKRLMLRLYFILVIALALVGGWYASRYWQVETEAIAALNMTEETNWVDFFAGIGEGTIQLFLGFTTD